MLEATSLKHPHKWGKFQTRAMLAAVMHPKDVLPSPRVSTAARWRQNYPKNARRTLKTFLSPSDLMTATPSRHPQRSSALLAPMPTCNKQLCQQMRHGRRASKWRTPCRHPPAPFRRQLSVSRVQSRPRQRGRWWRDSTSWVCKRDASCTSVQYSRARQHALVANGGMSGRSVVSGIIRL